jgi:hypothetical protein
MPGLDLSIRVTIEKCPIPWIWLDTSVILRIAEFKSNRLSDSVQRQRIGFLVDRLEPLVASGRVICPETSQADEIWRDRKRFTSVLNSLSMGLVMKPRAGLGDEQTYALMSSYVLGNRAVQLSYRDAFFREPVAELQRVMAFPVIVHVNRGLIDSIEKTKRDRENLAAGWERLRKECRATGVTFEVQHDKERKATFEALVQLVGAWLANKLAGRDSDLNETFAHLHLGELIHRWTELGGQPSGIRGVYRFMTSTYLAAHPYEDISSALCARLVTGSDPIQGGDIMDVEHIASVMPYADFMIVDRRMKHFVQSMGLDVKYGTTVCNSSDVDALTAFLDRVGTRPALTPAVRAASRRRQHVSGRTPRAPSSEGPGP